MSKPLEMKIDYANKKCLGGTMIWAADLDSKDGSASDALKNNTGRKDISMQDSTKDVELINSCYVTECAKKPTCKGGMSPVQQINGNKQDVNIGHGCDKGQHRTYCCPSDNMPTCQWRCSTPFCGGACHVNEGELDLTYDTGGCATGHKNLCCTKSGGNFFLGQCHWYGTAPSDRYGGCPSERPEEVVHTRDGDGQQFCDTHEGFKYYCCTKPKPYDNCAWYKQKDDPHANPWTCKAECPEGKHMVTTSAEDCWFGTAAYCCNLPSGMVFSTPNFDAQGC
jgi:chitinase